jgi:hypothetical protein
MKRLAQGEGKAGCIFYLLLVVVIGYAASQYIPRRIAVAELEDHMLDIALHQPNATRDQILKQILDRGKQLGLKVDEKRINIEKGRERVVMDVKFTEIIDLKVYQHQWEVKIFIDRPIFLGN